MRFVVVGAGAIGGGLGGALARSGSDVTLVARGSHLAALQRDGLRWRSPQHDERVQLPARALNEVEPRDGDLLCIATKLQDAEAALDNVVAQWGPDVPIATWTNGIDAHKWAGQRTSTVIATVEYVPASCPAPGEAAVWGQPTFGVVHAGVTTDRVGRGQALLGALVQALGDAGFAAYSHDNVLPLMHAKWLTNLHGAVKALVLPAHHDTVIAAVQAEGEAVCAAAGLEVAPFEELVPVPLELGTVDGTTRPGGSTALSLRAGKSLETPWLNGPAVTLGQQFGVATPWNAWLVDGAERAMHEGWREPRLTLPR